MSILVTNDDGIDSPGLWALAEAMSRVGDTMIVAPNKEQSGVGTGISLHSGMSIGEVPSSIPSVQAYAVGGTPSDCVILSIRQLAQGRRFDLLVSGINLGANVGRDVLYSGTVMATLQGYFRKIPSIAVSLVLRDRREDPSFDVAARVAERLALGIKAGDIATGAILNTNVPDVPLEEIKGIVTTRTALSSYVRLSELVGKGTVSYARGRRETATHPEGTDIWAISQDLVSITPLQPEVTDHDSVTDLAAPMLALQSDLLGKGDRG